jgi:hypothetical protein
VHGDGYPEGCKPHRGGKPGQSGPDNVHGARHQMKA